MLKNCNKSLPAKFSLLSPCFYTGRREEEEEEEEENKRGIHAHSMQDINLTFSNYKY